DTLSQISQMVNYNEESEENEKMGERDEEELFVSFSRLQQEIEESKIQIKLENILNILNNES
ncbi:1028_t:CDS:2, partial [Funneliformis geosporum]